MMDFIFGGRTGIASSDELARRRELVRALKARSAGLVPQNAWEGLNSLAEAIGGRIEENRLDVAEAAGRRAADEKFNSFLKSGLVEQAGDAPRLDAVSDPWMSESRRDVLKSHPQRQALHPKTESDLHKPEVTAAPKYDGMVVRTNELSAPDEEAYKSRQKSSSPPDGDNEAQYPSGLPLTSDSLEISDFHKQANRPRPVRDARPLNYGVRSHLPAFVRKQAGTGPG